MPTRSTTRDEAETAVLAHALEVHQAALDAQRAELRAMVDELARSNAALTSARDRFRTLYDRAPTPYVTIDPGRTIVEANAAAVALLSRPREALLGTTLDTYVEDVRRAMFRAFVERVFATGGAHSQDLTILRDGAMIAGGTADVLIDGVVLGGDGDATCVLGLVDITARRAAEAARRKAQDEVLGIVSHVLRGPLNAIVLACDALKSDADPAERAECVIAIERAATRCVGLIKDLLQVVQLESGGLVLNRTWLDLGDLARVLCSDHATAATAARCELTCVVDGGDHVLHGDHVRLYQIGANLIGNALVHAKGAPVEVSVRPDGDALVLAVSDQGPGIAQHEQARVFDRFRELGRGRGGAGLGLAIVKGLVTAHGGTVTLVSKPGLGARFEARLPRGPTPS